MITIAKRVKIYEMKYNHMTFIEKKGITTIIIVFNKTEN